VGFWGNGNLIDKLDIVNYSKPALVGGLVIMLFFGAFANNQSALAGILVPPSGQTFVVRIDGVLFRINDFFTAVDDFCGNHIHAKNQISVFSLDGTVELLEPTVDDGPDGEDCGWVEPPGLPIDFALGIFLVTPCTSPGTVCRASAGVCDIAEVCTSEGICPADAFISLSTTPCEKSLDECLEDAFCDGTGPFCPVSEDSPQGKLCLGEDQTVNDCNLANTCDGIGFCVENLVEGGAPCGDTTNSECNEADTCDGAGVCEDNFVAAEVACGDSLDSTCDSSDTCDGAGSCLDNIAPLDTTCGDQSTSECNLPDTCDGGGFCDPNFVDADLLCGDLTDTECNPADRCDGAGVCIENQLSSGSPCGDDTDNDCNEADTCEGGVCQDNIVGVSVPCGDDTDTVCNAEDTCDGDGTCLDNFAGIQTACGDSSSKSCDLPDTCDGVGACSANFVLSGLLCDDFSATECSDPDTCDGVGMCLKNNLRGGTACGSDLNNACTSRDVCSDGICEPNNSPDGTKCFAGLDPLCKNQECSVGVCKFLSNKGVGTVCIPGLTACREDTKCDAAGGCTVGGGPVNCNDSDRCTLDLCNPFSGCVYLPNTSDPICIGGNACTDVAGQPIDCNDLNQCTADSCDISSGCVNTPITGSCDDENSCTSNDMCDSSGLCVGNSAIPACLIIAPDPSNESFKLNYSCEDNNAVSVFFASFTRDGVPLEPSNLSFSCPPGITLNELEFNDIPNDFQAEVIINGVEGICIIEIGEDITSISFDLDLSGQVECFRGEGSAAMLILSPPAPVAAAVSGGGGGGGDKTAPNFKSMSVFGAKSLQEDGTYGFGGILKKEILLTNDMPTAIIEAGTDVTFRLLLHENSGKQGLQHITLYILDQADVTVQQSEEFLRYDNGKVTLKDSNGIFSNGNISFVERGADVEVVFEFTAKTPMPLSDIIIRAWDSNKNMKQAKFYDAIEIVPSSEETFEFGGKIEGLQPLWSNEMLSGWAGYSEKPVSDSELLSQIGIEGQQIPSWFKNKVAKWVIDGTVTHQELVNAMKFFENTGLLT